MKQNEIKKVALNFCISDASFKVDREKKKEKKIDPQCQVNNEVDTRAPPLCKEH